MVEERQSETSGAGARQVLNSEPENRDPARQNDARRGCPVRRYNLRRTYDVQADAPVDRGGHPRLGDFGFGAERPQQPSPGAAARSGKHQYARRRGRQHRRTSR